MFGNPIGAKGAKKHNASTTAQTGSFLVLQAITTSSYFGANVSSVANGIQHPVSESFTKFTNITWGNAKDSNPLTGNQATDVILRSGERIEGPIYGFTMTTGSCLAYLF